MALLVKKGKGYKKRKKREGKEEMKKIIKKPKDQKKIHTTTVHVNVAMKKFMKGR